MSELRDLGIKLKPFWKKFNPKNAPDCVLFSVVSLLLALHV